MTSAIRAWHAGMDDHDRSLLCSIIIERLDQSPSLVEVCLVQALGIREASGRLIQLLNRERSASLMSRALIRALQDAGGVEAYPAIERFVESDQEWEALMALARLDFTRALPKVIRAIRRDSHLDLGLQIFHERCKAIGWDAFCSEFRTWMAWADPELRVRLFKVFTAKPDPYHPFPADQRRVLMRLLEETP